MAWPPPGLPGGGHDALVSGVSGPFRAALILNRSVNRAMARDKVMRNVVSLCTVPHGLDGRPSNP
jgi:hypothetical protein